MFDCVFELVGVWQQINLDENIGQFDVVNIVVDMILIFQINDFVVVVFYFCGLCIQNNVDVFQVVQFVLQNLVGFYFWCKFQQCYVFNDICQVNCCFYVGVIVVDNCYVFIFKQWVVVVWVVGYVFGVILIFVWNVYVVLFCIGCYDNVVCFQYCVRSCFNLMQIIFNCCWDQFVGVLVVDYINVVFINVNFQCVCQFLFFSFWYRNVVFDINGIEDLIIKMFVYQIGMDVFMCGVNCCCCICWVGIDD